MPRLDSLSAALRGLAVSIAVLLASAPGPTHILAQTVAQQTPAPAPASASTPAATLPALFLSDIHLDPFIDPTKAPALDAAPITQWDAILASPSGPALTPARAAAFKICFDGPDTSYPLWRSTLAELKTAASSSRFVVISGDLLGHKFDCKYNALVPSATPSSYLAFTTKTVAYVLTTLRAALPAIPIYTALGNNDSGCVDYALDPTHDAFLAALAPLVSNLAKLAPADRTPAQRDFAALGSYAVPLAPLPHTRLVVLDDLYFSSKYKTCSGASTPAPAAAELAWLNAQLAAARAQGDRVWVLGHIPPGVDVYATMSKRVDVCASDPSAKHDPTNFLANESLAQALVANADTIHLALFGHTHDDELRLLTPAGTSDQPSQSAPALTANSTQSPAAALLGVPLKMTASITPVHGNRPSFTLARVDPATSTLVDFTVVMASDPSGVSAVWSPEYTFSTAYHQPAFDAASLTSLIAAFQADPAAKSPASQTYLRSYFPSEAGTATANAAVIAAAWQPYACSLNHDSAASFAACACAR